MMIRKYKNLMDYQHSPMVMDAKENLEIPKKKKLNSNHNLDEVTKESRHKRNVD